MILLINQSAKYNWRGKSFLIADEDESSSRYLDILIKRVGGYVIKTNNGVDTFLECIKNPVIDLVLLDIKLPRMNGIDTVRLIHKYRPDIICIAETAYTPSMNKSSIKNLPFHNLLIKPIDRIGFYATLQIHLENYNPKPFVNILSYN